MIRAAGATGCSYNGRKTFWSASVVDPVLDACHVDRTAVSVVKLTDPSDDLAYWLSRPPEERWEAID